MATKHVKKKIIEIVSPWPPIVKSLIVTRTNYNGLKKTKEREPILSTMDLEIGSSPNNSSMPSRSTGWAGV